MAKPVGLDLTAHSGSNNGKQDDILYSWYGADDSANTSAGSDTDLSFANPAQNEASARNLALNEFLTSKRGDLRGRLLDQPESRAESVKTADVPRVTLVDNAPQVAAHAEVQQAKSIVPTNLEITYNKPEVLNKPLTPVYSAEQLVDMGFAQLRQLEGPNSMSSRWMQQNRPDLAAQFASDSSSLQIGSHPDGTVHKILTSPEGNRWSMTAKGSTSVEIITDRNGMELFKHAGRASSTKDVLSA